jgi:hypothetical protein
MFLQEVSPTEPIVYWVNESTGRMIRSKERQPPPGHREPTNEEVAAFYSGKLLLENEPL